MRNDAFDELDSIPSLTTEQRDSDILPAPAPPRRGGGASTGALWALVGALLIALAGLGWWSHRQIELVSQQLVATQESFARISEEAAGRIRDISGKVVATESNVTSGTEALRLQVKQLDARLAALAGQAQTLSAQQEGNEARFVRLGERLEQQLKASQDAASALEQHLQALAGELAPLKAQLAAQAELGDRLKALDGELNQLKRREDPAQAISRLEQDLLVVRSELETRPAAASDNAEFDAFRAQMSRSVNALQAQMQSLQKQLDARR